VSIADNSGHVAGDALYIRDHKHPRFSGARNSFILIVY
jgi:hypothetical protein